MKDYYKILGVSPSSSKEEIQRAYKKKIKENHPDLVQDKEKRKKAEESCKMLNEAKDTLLDSKKRKEYDFQRQNSYSHSESGYYRRPSEGRYITYSYPGGFSGFENFESGFSFNDDFLYELLKDYYGFQKTRTRRTKIHSETLFEIKLEKNLAERLLPQIEHLMDYYHLSLIDYNIKEGTKYYTVYLYIDGTEKNLKVFKEFLKKKGISVVRKQRKKK